MHEQVASTIFSGHSGGKGRRSELWQADDREQPKFLEQNVFPAKIDPQCSLFFYCSTDSFFM
ncbi:hypothetical protein OG196_11415 [Kitasatospora purpeofusca]|uniref:hypothetical protein n=1 Tax=Kitasatospora purpeofusca TaxID=67352 RepID=UPI002E137B64|nr:hypothetical protein OG196_11415 [Kitasatospora purpeofusca]